MSFNSFQVNEIIHFLFVLPESGRETTDCRGLRNKILDRLSAQNKKKFQDKLKKNIYKRVPDFFDCF